MSDLPELDPDSEIPEPYEPLLLDANALLNAAFVSKSWSALVVNEAAKRKFRVFLGEHTRAEAVDVARRCAAKLGKRVDPVNVLDGFIKISKFIILKTPNGDVPDQIPDHDAHVYLESQSVGATILTSDAKLWLACGNGAVLPLELLKYWDPRNIGPLMYGVMPTADAGSIFFRGIATWGGSNITGSRFFAADLSGTIRVYYDGTSNAWVGEIVDQVRLSLDAEVSQERNTVALSWQKGRQATLRVAGVSETKSAPMNSSVQKPIANASIGGSHTGGGSWNGHIKSFVLNDAPIGDGLWRTLRQSDVLTPNPFDSDRLEQGISRALPY